MACAAATASSLSASRTGGAVVTLFWCVCARVRARGMNVRGAKRAVARSTVDKSDDVGRVWNEPLGASEGK